MWRRLYPFSRHSLESAFAEENCAALMSVQKRERPGLGDESGDPKGRSSDTSPTRDRQPRIGDTTLVVAADGGRNGRKQIPYSRRGG